VQKQLGELTPTIGLQEKAQKGPTASPTLKPLNEQIPSFPQAPQTTEVHISIGRVEVRATSEEKAVAPAPHTRQPASEVMSLDAYLAQRTGEKG
jgi:hypothetical protein